MSQNKFPGFQNMISAGDAENVQKNIKMWLGVYEAQPEECVIKNLEMIPEYELAYKQGLRVRYQLHWTTYKGYKTYMATTGVMVL